MSRKAEADPQPALEPVDLGKALVPEDEPSRAVEHAKALGHVAERGVAQVLLRAVRRGEPVEAAAEAEPDRRAGGDRRKGGGLLRNQADGDRGTNEGHGADRDPRGAGAPAGLPPAGEKTGGGKCGEQGNAARQDRELPGHSDREEWKHLLLARFAPK